MKGTSEEFIQHYTAPTATWEYDKDMDGFQMIRLLIINLLHTHST
jgi:hypothetical protein